MDPRILFDYDFVAQTPFKGNYTIEFIVPRFVGYQYFVLGNPSSVKTITVVFIDGTSEVISKVPLGADLLGTGRPSKAVPVLRIVIEWQAPETEITEHYIEALEPDATVVSASVTINNVANIITAYSPPGSVAIPNASTVVLNANPARKHVVIVNDGSQEVYLSFGAAAVAGKGVRLNKQGGSYEIDDRNLWQGAIYGITASGSSSLTVHEGI